MVIVSYSLIHLDEEHSKWPIITSHILVVVLMSSNILFFLIRDSLLLNLFLICIIILITVGFPQISPK